MTIMESASSRHVQQVAELVRRHPGNVPLRLVLDLADGTRVLMEADRHAVAWTA